MKRKYEKPVAELVGVFGINPFMGILSNNGDVLDPENDEETEDDGRSNLGAAWEYDEKLMLK